MYFLPGLRGIQVSAFRGRKVPRRGVKCQSWGGGCRRKFFSLSSFQLFPVGIFQSKADGRGAGFRSACPRASQDVAKGCCAGAERSQGGAREGQRAGAVLTRAFTWPEWAELNPGADRRRGERDDVTGTPPRSAAQRSEEAAAAGEAEEVLGPATSEWHWREARCRGGEGLRERYGAPRPYQCPLAVPAPPSIHPATA